MKESFEKIKDHCEYVAGYGVYCWSVRRAKGVSLCIEKNCPKMKKTTENQSKGKKK